MPFPTLNQTPSAGQSEVLRTMQYLHANPLRKPWPAARIAEVLQPLFRLRDRGADVLDDVQAAIDAMIAADEPLVQEDGTGLYKLTDAGVLEARRARPYAIRP